MTSLKAVDQLTVWGRLFCDTTAARQDRISQCAIEYDIWVACEIWGSHSGITSR
jgi:hypothetical protein